MEHVQLGLALGALEAEQEAVVEVGRIVDAVLVEDQRVAQRADLGESVPSIELRASRDTSSPSTMPA